jgi:hypothetical protein
LEVANLAVHRVATEWRKLVAGGEGLDEPLECSPVKEIFSLEEAVVDPRARAPNAQKGVRSP